MNQSLTIKNMVPSLLEWGKIKIGKKGSWVRDKFQKPEKIDHFLITTMERGEDNNFVINTDLMDKLCKEQGVDKLKKIPIMFLYHDPVLNFQSRYACFDGKTRWCTGDGETAQRLISDKGNNLEYEEIECPCERVNFEYPGEDGKGKKKCKATGCLSCLIRGADRMGGVWKFRTAGYNSVRSITSSLALYKTTTGGILAGIDFSLTVTPKSTTEPIGGKPVTIYVANIEFEGSPVKLMSSGYEIAKLNATHLARIESAEQEARKMISSQFEDDIINNNSDFVEEFYPNEVQEETHLSEETKTEDKPKSKKRNKISEPDPEPNVKKEPEPKKEPEQKPEKVNRVEFDLFD